MTNVSECWKPSAGRRQNPAQPSEQAKAAQNSLIGFSEYTLPTYEVASHHRLISEKLEGVDSGDIRKLMIFVPPRHGKSELASIRFPAWYIGKNPQKQIIACSYAKELAMDFGRKVRNLLQLPEYADVFGNLLSNDSTASYRWDTKHGGSYLAAGIGGPITGRGADLLIIDDPIKNRQDANSQLYRDHVWDWYRSTAFTRLMPGACQVVIQTRWHEDDLAGRLLDQEGQQWDVLELPAIQDGQALWDAWYPLEVLEEIRQTIGPREWSSLYEQKPAPDDGAYFKRKWFRRFAAPPDRANLRIYGASDYAVTQDGGDYTVHLVAGVDPVGDIYILDIWRGQTETAEWIEAFIDLVQEWKPQLWAEESGQILKSVGPFLEKRLVERNVYVTRDQYASAADKPTRARSIQARVQMGKVRLPTTEAGEALLSECLRFPAGKHDDQVDCLALLGRMLDDMGIGREFAKLEPRAATRDDADKARRQRRLGLGRVSYYVGDV